MKTSSPEIWILKKVTFNLKKGENLNDFLTENSLEDILNKLEDVSLTKGKIAKGYRQNTLMLLVSMFAQQKNLHYDEKTQAIFNKLTSMLEKFSENAKNYVEALSDFYFMFGTNSEFKPNVLAKLYNILLTKVDKKTFIRLSPTLSEIGINFAQETFSTDEKCKIYNDLAEICFKFFCFEPLENTGISNDIISVAESSSSTTENLAKLFFYVNLKTITSQHLKLDLKEIWDKTMAKHKHSLPNEYKLLEILNDYYQIDQLNQVDFSYFENIYGNSICESIKINCKTRTLYSLVKSLKTKNIGIITFEDLFKKHNLHTEDVEDVLYDADCEQLFQLRIDYEKSLIEILFVRDLTFNQTKVEHMQQNLKKVSEKLRGFIAKIDKVIEEQ